MRLARGRKPFDVGKDRPKIGDRRPGRIGEDRNKLLDMSLEPLASVCRAPKWGPDPHFRRQRHDDHPRLLASIVIGLLVHLPARSDECGDDSVSEANEALKGEDGPAIDVGHIAIVVRELDSVGERSQIVHVVRADDIGLPQRFI
jgi:hypothetical protein